MHVLHIFKYNYFDPLELMEKGFMFSFVLFSFGRFLAAGDGIKKRDIVHQVG